jgi:hypothetical protein
VQIDCFQEGFLTKLPQKQIEKKILETWFSQLISISVFAPPEKTIKTK